MTEQEHAKLTDEIIKNIEFSGNNLKNINFHIKRIKKILKNCKETCESTNDIIGDINGQQYDVK